MLRFLPITRFVLFILLVAPLSFAITVYVSPTGGDDGNAGTESAPFATLHHARDQIRASNDSQKEVILLEGDYFLENTLTLTEDDGGTEQNPVVWKAQDGAEVRIFGGQRITGWTEVSGSIYKANVGSSDTEFWTLSENGKRSLPARHPNHMENEIHGATKSTLDSKAQADYPADLFPSNWDYTHARVNVTCYGWFSQCRPVESVDFGNRVITFDGRTRDEVGVYWVEGSKDFIDIPTEWALDGNGDVFYWPAQTPIEDQVIVAGTLKRVIEFKGSSQSDPVKHIIFEGILVSTSDCTRHGLSNKEAVDGDNIVNGEANCESDYSRHGLIHLENAEHITIRKCRIFNAGIMGVLFNNYAQYNTLTNCWIEGVNYCAVYLTSYCIGSGPWDYINHHNTITNNFIHDFGKLWSNGSGVQIYQSGDNDIGHNLIRRGPRYAVSMKGMSDTTFIKSNNNNIHHNEICHTLNSTWDTGTLEAWNAGTGNKWDTNLFHDIFHITIPTRTYNANGDPFPVGIGISQRHCMYPDAGPAIEITDNVAYNIIDYIDWHHNAPGGGKTFPNSFYPHPYTRAKAKAMAEDLGIAFDDIGLSDDFPFPTPQVREYEYPVEAEINPIYEEDIYSLLGDGAGLTGVYYSGADFDQQVIARVDPLPAKLWSTSPAGTNTWSARWTGKVVPIYSEEHRFCATTNGGCRMWVNGAKVFDEWETFSPGEPWEAKDTRLILSREFIPLEAGEEYEVTIEFFSQSSDANLAIDWYSHSMPTQVIPTSQLKPDPAIEVGIGGPVAGNYNDKNIRLSLAKNNALISVPFKGKHSVKLIAPNGVAIKTFKGAKAGNYSVSTQHLAAGVYLVSVQSDKGSSVQRMVIRK
ncbi:MAG: hypothetical protein GF401_06565 [Chitinivibrionales bacterium]|nr:hypothetical protein [Chitinivibrionales bacterium]